MEEEEEEMGGACRMYGTGEKCISSDLYKIADTFMVLYTVTGKKLFWLI